MNFCCIKFETHWKQSKESAPNIRIAKFTTGWLINSDNMGVKSKMLKINKLSNLPYRFFITWGYLKEFSLDNVHMNISFCPFCGVNLHDFYKNDKYANEIEGETFFL